MFNFTQFMNSPRTAEFIDTQTKFGCRCTQLSEAYRQAKSQQFNECIFVIQQPDVMI